MGFLSDLDYENVPDLTTLPDGEYELRIVEAADYISKTSGKSMVRVLLEPVNEPNAEPIYYYLIMPEPDDDERKRNFKLRKVKQFMEAFQLGRDEDYDDWIGREAWALVSQGTDQNGSPRNDIKRFIVSA